MALTIPIMLLFLGFILWNVRRSRFNLKYTYLWIIFAFTSLLPLFFGQFVDSVFVILGFGVPANGILTCSILFLAFICLHLSLELSSLERRFENLVTKMSIELTDKDKNFD